MNKYERIADRLATQIRQDNLRPGDRLSSHAELVDRFSVSRGTITKALSVLETRGLVRTHQGRGTFVRSSHQHSASSVLRGFTESVRAEGRAPGARLVEITAVRSTGVSEHEIFPPAIDLLSVERVRTVDGEVVGVHRVLIPMDLAERTDLERVLYDDPNASIYELFDRHGVVIDTSSDEMDAISADDRLAELLGVEPGAPLLRVRRLSHDTGGEPIETVDAAYVPTRFHIRASNHRSDRRPDSDHHHQQRSTP